VLDEIKQRLLCPVQIVEHADEGFLLSLLLEQLAETPCDFLRRRCGFGFTEQ
jgi:hypothetical protein